MIRLIFPVLLGLVGCAILLALGLWQVQRLDWKAAVLARIETTIAADPVPVPALPDADADRFLPVTLGGALGGEELLVLTSVKDRGAGYRVISVLTSGDRRLLVDLGYIPLEARTASRMLPALVVTGNLNWPDEVDGWTPPPEGNLWFARDAAAMAQVLQAEPFLIVARGLSPAGSGSGLGVTPLPIDSSAIPNDHLNYAITWFMLAFFWALMSGYLIWQVAAGSRQAAKAN